MLYMLMLTAALMYTELRMGQLSTDNNIGDSDSDDAVTRAALGRPHAPSEISRHVETDCRSHSHDLSDRPGSLNLKQEL